MSKICTTIEQSKKLIKLGLDTNSADMFYISKADKTNSYLIPSNICIPRKKYGDGECEGEVFAWSLSALFELMPNKHDDSTTLSKGGYSLDTGNYVYDYFVEYENEIENIYHATYSSSPIDAAYKMVCWLLENGYIK